MTTSTLTANQVHQGDCIEKLSQLENGSVDLVFADPPFNIGYSYDVYDDQRASQDYLDFCSSWIGEVHRVLKDDGSFWLAIGDEYAAELKVLSQQLGFHCRSWVIWYYTFGVNCVRGFSRSHTHIFYFVKDRDKFTFNGDNPMVRVPSARQLVYADARANAKGRLPDNTWILRPQDSPPMGFSPSHDTWYYARVAGTFKEREGFHGCQMPEQLLGRIIRVSSNPGDLVLDPFGGSGTTLAVAKKLGRQFMGFELSEEYVQRINERLDGCKVGDALDGPVDPVKSAPTTKKGKQRTEFKNGRPVIPMNKAIARTVANAFEDASPYGRDVCAEDVLLDPERVSVFVDYCKKEKLLGDARTWLEYLLELSRDKALPDAVQFKADSLKEIDAISDAAEIAFQMLSVDYALSIDALMCSPDAADEFDRTASLFAESGSPIEFRRAIWSLHQTVTAGKHTRQVKKLAGSFLESESPEAQSIESFLEQYDETMIAGVYAISDAESVLYVGQSSDVVAHVRRTQTCEGWQRFQPTEVQFWPIKKRQDALIHRSLLVTWLRPWLNAHFMHQPIATKLF
ncbi:site-specific DNA-methyltransferase [Stieleria sp. JC731]|uniref:DNA-methyltransferase n=1 Tax=Pirellulaceae TaxID=2691357 RepID=UPI001E4DBD86|nr:site-specific DNA-methyltransferase [Stieleria sp. JC731]MCC9600839.1 site-specific DNA-methyltransferase [Stieleria sp. JC731]